MRLRLFQMLAVLSAVVCTHAATAPGLFQTKEDFARWAITALTPIIVWATARWWKNLPPKVLPVLAPLVGLALGYIAALCGVPGLTAIDSSTAGALGVFLREIINQWITKPVNNATKEGPDVPEPPPAESTPKV